MVQEQPEAGTEKAGSRAWPALLLALLLAACSSNYAPVVERSQLPAGASGEHVVRRGETLYAIAWRHGVDPRRLAEINQLRPPYLIYPGQRLRLRPTTAGASTPPPAPTRPARGPSGKTAAAPAPAKPSSSPPPTATSDENWRWPAKGEILRGFSTTGSVHKGIDIKGELGRPVVAARSGQVVYAGSGLVGYGNLIIIKHDQVYLSAYGHNRRILVREGQSIKAGERIAEIGDSGTNTVMLHFEVRYNGQPVDPLKLLPRQ